MVPSGAKSRNVIRPTNVWAEAIKLQSPFGNRSPEVGFPEVAPGQKINFIMPLPGYQLFSESGIL
jgi:hypothetical protein